jgi:hypothetical protein
MERRQKVVVALSDRVEAAVVARWLDAKGFEPLTRAEMASESHDLVIADAGPRPGATLAGGPRTTRNPLILVGPARDESRGQAVSGQPMYLARPLDRATLICFVMMAILDRRQERRSVRKPIYHTEAYVNGLPVRIVDVSNEGLCLATPPDRSALLPPTFKVRIPLMGVSVAVQRVWGAARHAKRLDHVVRRIAGSEHLGRRAGMEGLRRYGPCRAGHTAADARPVTGGDVAHARLRPACSIAAASVLMPASIRPGRTAPKPSTRPPAVVRPSRDTAPASW